MFKSIIKELRLLLCSWCFSLILFFAPQDDPEGLIAIEAVKDWVEKSIKQIEGK